MAGTSALPAMKIPIWRFSAVTSARQSHRKSGSPSQFAPDPLDPVSPLKASHSKKADGVGFEAVSASPCGSNTLRRGDFEGEAKGEAVCPPALSGGDLAGATAAQAERLASVIEAYAIPTEVAELAAIWHRLPAAVRAGIVAMVRASRPVKGADD